MAPLNAAQQADYTQESLRREPDVDPEVFHCPSGEFLIDSRCDGIVVTVVGVGLL